MRTLILLILLVYQNNVNATKSFTEAEMEQGAELIMSLLLLFFDEPLDDEVKQFINYEFNTELADNAYVFLWGIDLDTEDPYAAGQYLIQQINAANAKYKHELEPYDHSFLNAYKRIEIKHEEFFCTFAELDCIEKIIENTPERAAAKRHNLKILDRYHQFFKFSNFNPLHRVNFDTPLPNYRLLGSGNQLELIKAMEYLDTGAVDLFYQNISTNLSQIKSKMAQAKTLLSKMVLLSMLDWNIELISHLLQSGRLNVNDKRLDELLKPLSPVEKSTKAGLVYDLSNWMYQQQLLFENPHYLVPHSDKKLGSTVVSLLLPLAFKSNLTLNIMYHQSMVPTLAYIDRDAKSFYSGFAEFDASSKYPPFRGYLSNLLASFMTDDMSTYLQYSARIHSMEMGIQLVRAWQNEGSWERVIEQASQGHQPYLSHYDNSPPYITEQQICYNGLFEFAAKNRCIFIRD